MTEKSLHAAFLDGTNVDDVEEDSSLFRRNSALFTE